MRIKRQEFSRFVAIFAAALFAVHIFAVSGLTVHTAASRPLIDAFGNPICSGGHSPDRSSGASGHDHAFTCCDACFCSAQTVSVAPPSLDAVVFNLTGQGVGMLTIDTLPQLPALINWQAWPRAPPPLS